MMKANELMIGDWVNADNRFEPCCILSLEEDKAWIQGKYQYPFYQYDKLTPISLTEEILKANGFRHNSNEYTYWPDEDGIEAPLCILQSNRYGLRICLQYRIITLQYVHELQHALRLCGLNELADNFKVK